jgi:hypothetical protein
MPNHTPQGPRRTNQYFLRNLPGIAFFRATSCLEPARHRALVCIMKGSPNQSRQPPPGERLDSSRWPLAPRGCTYRSAQ